MSAAATRPAPFSARVAAALVGGGVLLLLAMLILSGFGREIEQRTVRTPGVTARGATGFQALHDLIARLPGSTVTLVRDNAGLATPALLIVTPDASTRPADLADLLRRRGGRPTLIILPKWRTERDGMSPYRQRRARGDTDRPNVEHILSAVAPVHVWRDDGRTRRPRAGNVALPPIEWSQTVTGHGLIGWIAVRGQGAVLARLPDRAVWLLADPDIANNFGLRDRRNARAVVQALAAMNGGTLNAIAFDVSLHYRAGDRNLVKLMLTPPFVAVTIALFAAAMLAGWAGAARFGPALGEARAIPFGKAALIDNIALLTRRAGRVVTGGRRFADGRIARMGTRLHAPRGLKDAALIAWLDDRRPGLAERHAAVTNARDEAELLAAARSLDDFIKEQA